MQVQTANLFEHLRPNIRGNKDHGLRKMKFELKGRQLT